QGNTTCILWYRAQSPFRWLALFVGTLRFVVGLAATGCHFLIGVRFGRTLCSGQGHLLLRLGVRLFGFGAPTAFQSSVTIGGLASILLVVRHAFFRIGVVGSFCARHRYFLLGLGLGGRWFGLGLCATTATATTFALQMSIAF